VGNYYTLVTETLVEHLEWKDELKT
jgi:hypothetical protein